MSGPADPKLLPLPPTPSAKEMVESQVTLFRRIATGDSTAFAEFYDQAAGLMLSVAFRILGHREDAEEIIQEVFTSIWCNAHLFNGTLGSPTSWAIAITRNRCIDHLRKHRRRSRILDDALAFDLDPVPVDRNGMEQTELHRGLRAALEGLPANQRQLIELAFFGGLTQQQIARQLDLPLGTIKARIRRGLQRLRRPLQNYHRNTQI